MCWVGVSIVDKSATEGQDSITKNPFADHIPSFTSIELKGGCGFGCGYYFPLELIFRTPIRRTFAPKHSLA